MAYERITEIKRVKVDSECKENPIYLEWLNTPGGPSYWLFSRTNTKTNETSPEGEYNKNEPDLEAAMGSAEYISKNVKPGIVIGANVPREDMDGIRGLINSPKVSMLMNPETWETEGPVWQRVKIRTGSFIILRESETRMEIELTILTPEINVQSE